MTRGLDEAKAEQLEEIIEFLKNPQNSSELGGKIDAMKGVLFWVFPC